MMRETIAENPKAFGLEHVALVSDHELSYEFDQFLILRDPRTGEYLWASDSGCSCPIPFEDTTVESMARGSGQDCLNDLRAWASSDFHSVWGGRADAWKRAQVSDWFKGME